MTEKNKTFFEWLDYWLSTYAKYRVKEGTYLSYSCGVNLIKKVSEDKKLQEIVESDVQEIINLLYEEGYSKSTLRTVKIVMKDAFDRAIKNRIVLDNPADDLFIPIDAAVKYVEALSREEQAEVEKACYENLHGDKFLFLLKTGLRRCELCNLKWSDYYKDKKIITVRKSKTKAGIRPVPLLPQSMMIIELQPKINEYIFNSTKGTPITPSVMKKTYKRLRKATGITKLTNHVCRHTFATRLIENGADPKTVSALLGHTNVSFTLNRYTDAKFEHLIEQIQLLDNTN